MGFTGQKVLLKKDNLRGTVVGSTVKNNKTKLEVQFEDGEKTTFSYPADFLGRLVFADPEMQKKAARLAAQAMAEDDYVVKGKASVTTGKKFVSYGPGGQVTVKKSLDTVTTSTVRKAADESSLTSKLAKLTVKDETGCTQQIIIVKNHKEQDTAHGIYWDDKSISLEIVEALATGTLAYTYKDKKYTITDVKKFSGYAKWVDKWRELNNPDALHQLTVYRQRGVYEDPAKGYDLVNARLFFPERKRAFSVPVYYQGSNGMFFMNQESFDGIVKRYGYPKADLIFTDNEGKTDNLWGLSEESKLKKLGYNVQQGIGMSQAERQQLLSSIILAGLMQDYEITSHLEMLLNLNSGKPSMQNACACWQEDLRFVQKKFAPALQYTKLPTPVPAEPKARPVPKTPEKVPAISRQPVAPAAPRKEWTPVYTPREVIPEPKTTVIPTQKKFEPETEPMRAAAERIRVPEEVAVQTVIPVPVPASEEPEVPETPEEPNGRDKKILEMQQLEAKRASLSWIHFIQRYRLKRQIAALRAEIDSMKQ